MRQTIPWIALAILLAIVIAASTCHHRQRQPRTVTVHFERTGNDTIFLAEAKVIRVKPDITVWNFEVFSIVQRDGEIGHPTLTLRDDLEERNLRPFLEMPELFSGGTADLLGISGQKFMFLDPEGLMSFYDRPGEEVIPVGDTLWVSFH